jgi:pimeloyl-ACP methyl ester carboxylesterase
VLVGHSTGCPVATLAADALPEIKHIVYLAGPLPVEGKPLAFDSGGGRRDDGTVTTMSDFGAGADDFLRVSADGRFFTVDYEGAVACFFHDCDPDTAAWAFERLTPQCIDVMVVEPISVPRFWSADIPRSFIRCADDGAFPRRLSQRQIDRLGVTPLEIAGSHSPFLSRPAELARLLVHAAGTRPTGPLDPGR